MRKVLVLVAVALLVASLPAMAAKVVNVPIPHDPFTIYQAYCGQTCSSVQGNKEFLGTAVGADVIKAVPGVLSIVPGDAWANFVTAAGKVAYTVTNVTLRKTVPAYECTVPVGGLSVLQQGTANITTWWPLMYEIPGTKWTLTITYKTPVWNDGVPGNLPATTHQDVWVWQVGASFGSIIDLINLFSELPAGSCQVPLINNKALADALVAEVQALQAITDPAELSDAYAAFVLHLSDLCVTVDCGTCSPELGIRNTTENPACCKLLADADFLAEELGFNQAAK